jgi:hypothetical protein
MFTGAKSLITFFIPILLCHSMHYLVAFFIADLPMMWSLMTTLGQRKRLNLSLKRSWRPWKGLAREYFCAMHLSTCGVSSLWCYRKMTVHRLQFQWFNSFARVMSWGPIMYGAGSKVHPLLSSTMFPAAL